MPVEQILLLVLGNGVLIILLFLWSRSELRSDFRHMDAKLEATRELVRATYEVTKEFHARLCAIEERNKK